MDSFLAYLEELQTPAMNQVADYLVQSLYPAMEEVGFRRGNSGVHIHEDGTVELHAGAAAIILDPAREAVYIRGQHLGVLSDKANFSTREPLGLNEFAFDPSQLFNTQVVTAEGQPALNLVQGGELLQLAKPVSLREETNPWEGLAALFNEK